MRSTLVERSLKRLAAARRRRLSADQVSAELASRRGLLVLCYHAVGEHLPGYAYALHRDTFRSHLEFLVRHFRVMDAAAAAGAVTKPAATVDAGPSVLVTFDDGFADNLDVATPILEEFGVPGLLFAARNLIEGPRATFLSPSGLSDLATHRLWTVGGHSCAHLSLNSMLDTDAAGEVEECADWLAGLLPEPARHFAYPYGRHSPAAVEAVSRRFDTGYAVTAPVGDAVDRWRIPRVLVTRDQADGIELGRMLLAHDFLPCAA